MPDTQNYQNHTRWFPLVHFVIFPLLTINLIWAIASVAMEFDWNRVQYLLLSTTVVLMAFAARLQALKAQDRVIRMEERLRYTSVLQPEIASIAYQLRASHLIALRFASDEELPDLVRRVSSGELPTSKEIKLAIKEWRPDYF